MAGSVPAVKVPRFEDNYRNFTFVLNDREFAFAQKTNRIQETIVPGRPLLRDFWIAAAKVRGLLDLALPAKGQTPKAAGKDPRTERASGDEAYFAALEQAAVAIVSAWEVFLREVVRHVLNCTSFVDRLAGREDQPLRKLMRDFRLLDEVTLDFVSSGFDASKVRLGDIAADNRRGIRWQNLDDCKAVIVTLFPDLNIAELATDWPTIKKLFDHRHQIVHAAGQDVRMVEEPDFDWADGEAVIMGTVMAEETYDIIKDYNTGKIEAILEDLLQVTDDLHERLFSVYQPDK